MSPFDTAHVIPIVVLQ